MPKCPFCKEREPTGAELQEHLVRKHPEEVTDLSAGRNTQKKKFKKKDKLPPIVVDGNNVAYFNNEPPEVSNIKSARAYLIKKGFSPIIYVSAALRHEIDNTMELLRMINLNWVIEVETGENDDEMAIEEALRKKCKIVSNDNFKEFLGTYKAKDWKLKDSIKNFTFEDGKFKLV